MWPSIIVLMMRGTMITSSEQFLNYSVLMNEYFVSCSNSQADLLAIKALAQDTLSNSFILMNLKAHAILATLTY